MELHIAGGYLDEVSTGRRRKLATCLVERCSELLLRKFRDKITTNFVHRGDIDDEHERQVHPQALPAEISRFRHRLPYW